MNEEYLGMQSLTFLDFPPEKNQAPLPDLGLIMAWTWKPQERRSQETNGNEQKRNCPTYESLWKLLRASESRASMPNMYTVYSIPSGLRGNVLDKSCSLLGDNSSWWTAQLHSCTARCAPLGSQHVHLSGSRPPSGNGKQCYEPIPAPSRTQISHRNFQHVSTSFQLMLTASHIYIK